MAPASSVEKIRIRTMRTTKIERGVRREIFLLTAERGDKWWHVRGEVTPGWEEHAYWHLEMMVRDVRRPWFKVV